MIPISLLLIRWQGDRDKNMENTELIKQGLRIEKTTQTIKLFLMAIFGLIGVWGMFKIIYLLKVIIGILLI